MLFFSSLHGILKAEEKVRERSIRSFREQLLSNTDDGGMGKTQFYGDIFLLLFSCSLMLMLPSP